MMDAIVSTYFQFRIETGKIIIHQTLQVESESYTLWQIFSSLSKIREFLRVKGEVIHLEELNNCVIVSQKSCLT